MSNLFSPVIAVLLFASPATTLTAGGDDVDCHKDLKKAIELVDARWSFKLFKPGTVDFEEVYKQLAPEAKRAKTPEACADILSRFMAKLQDGHSSLSYFPGLEHTRPKIDLRSQRERLSQMPGELPKVHVYVVSRDTTDETLASILPGSEIVAVDGTPANELFTHMEKRASGSTQQWRDYVCDRNFLRGPADTDVQLTIRKPSGARSTVVVHRPPYPSDEERKKRAEANRRTARIVEWKRLEGGWGYIKYTTFHFVSIAKTLEPLDEAIDSLMDAPGLILDLRRNGGGYVEAMTGAAGRFIDGRIVLERYQVREPGQNVVYEIYDETTMTPTTRPPILAKPRGPIYRRPLVILIDRGCFSACEGFTGGLQSVHRALVIGPEASGGGSGMVSGLELPSGAIIRFSWSVGWRPDGRQIETNGVYPDIRVRERARDWAAGRDRVLDRAIEALVEGEAPTIAAMTTQD